MPPSGDRLRRLQALAGVPADGVPAQSCDAAINAALGFGAAIAPRWAPSGMPLCAHNLCASYGSCACGGLRSGCVVAVGLLVDREIERLTGGEE